MPSQLRTACNTSLPVLLRAEELPPSKATSVPPETSVLQSERLSAPVQKSRSHGWSALGAA